MAAEKEASCALCSEADTNAGPKVEQCQRKRQPRVPSERLSRGVDENERQP